jgi:hypothetical protein
MDVKQNDGAKTWYEEFSVSGSELLDKVKDLVHEGNVRRLYIKNSDGRTLLEIPLTAGVAITAVAAVVAPVLVAVGAAAALLTKVTLGVEREVEAATPDPVDAEAADPDAPRIPAVDPAASEDAR